jgi:ketosteroid isomerase-like protein
MTESANEAITRSVYEAYAEGDLARMLQFVDSDLEWTYLDPADEDPQPQVCHGWHELATPLKGLLDSGLRSYIEEVRSQHDRVMVLVRTPGIDRCRAYKADDCNYNVLTVRGDQIVAIRECRDREEAIAVAGIE